VKWVTSSEKEGDEAPDFGVRGVVGRGSPADRDGQTTLLRIVLGNGTRVRRSDEGDRPIGGRGRKRMVAARD